MSVVKFSSRLQVILPLVWDAADAMQSFVWHQDVLMVRTSLRASAIAAILSRADDFCMDFPSLAQARCMGLVELYLDALQN